MTQEDTKRLERIQRRLKNIRNNFFLSYVSVVLLAVASILAVNLFFVEKQEDSLRANLNKITQSIVNKLREEIVFVGKESLAGDFKELFINNFREKIILPATSRHDYTSFIIDDSGDFLVPRVRLRENGSKEWQRYQNKLIYEMSKLKKGWIVYPEKKMWPFGREIHVIRYLSVNETGWVVALEGSLDPKPFMVFDQKFYLQWLVILAIGFFGIKRFIDKILFSISKAVDKRDMEQFIVFQDEVSKIETKNKKQKPFFERP